jgi:transcriptional regulator with XRE-family HTH domain
MTANTDRIAARIKQARQLSGMTQEEAADALNVSARTYIRWEHGDSQGYMERLDAIASTFGTTSQELIGDQAALLADLIAEFQALRQEVREALGVSTS